MGTAAQLQVCADTGAAIAASTNAVMTVKQEFLIITN